MSEAITRLSSARRPLAIGGAVVAAWALFNYAIAPETAPPGVLLFSAFQGLLTALTAAALILVYRSVRAINFAQIAIGAVGATLLFELASRRIVPWGVALPAGLIGGTLIGAILGGLIVTLFFKHPRLVLTVATLIFAGALTGAQFGLASLFHDDLNPDRPIDIPVPGWPNVQLDGIPFRTDHVVGAVLAIAALVGLAIFLKRSRMGMAIRASAENAERTSLLGVNVKAVQIVVWTIAGLFGAIAASFKASTVGHSIGAGGDPVDLFVPLVAAVVARMHSLPVAVAAAIGMPIVQETIRWSYAETAAFDIGVFAVLLVALLFQRRFVLGRSTEGASWSAIKEIRPIPREMLAVPAINIARRVLYAFLFLAVLGYPWIAGPGLVLDAQFLFIFAIAAVSLVMLTGWMGQMSLGHFALVAVGGWAGAILTTEIGVPFWFALPLGAGAGALVAFLVGIPAIRMRGLFLAVTTFALAIAMPIILFNESFLGSLIPERGTIERPTLFFLNFDDPRSMYYLLLGMLGAAYFIARSLRRSRTGRILIAIREDEAGAQSFGIDITRTRLAAFALSGAFAGFAGVLLAHHQLAVQEELFGVGQSILLFQMVIVGGLGSLAGGLLGPALFIAVPRIISNPVWSSMIVQTVPILVLVFVPGGLMQVVSGMRDAVLRVVATRRHMIVPSLFADYSREAWEQQKVPLAPAMQNRGLGALDPEQRYSMPSRLFTPTEQKART